MSLKAIDKISFINEVNIRALNIDSYFKRFKSGTLTLHSEKMSLEDEKKFDTEILHDNFIDFEKGYIDFIKECYNLNNGNLIIDFYVERLDDEAIVKILEVLNLEEKSTFLDLIDNIDKDKIYFRVNDLHILDIIVKLNTRNMFFSTFYFLEKELTLWGNYNLQFPLFFKDDGIIKFYDDIAKNNKLNIL